jgi:methylglutaconyl-CoA hydratase
MGYTTLELATDTRGIATLTLNRPEKHNALDAEMIAELRHAADALAKDISVRVVVLTGAGKSFCAGGDLDWMRQQFDATRPQRMEQARELALMLRDLNTLPKPLIGRVQGSAFGGGVGMLSVCDAVVAVESAKFGLTETRLGLIPATIAPYVVARLGEGKARRVFMSARVFDAAEAKELGLLGRIASAEKLDAAMEAEIVPYLSTAPSAVARTKALARDLGPNIDDAVISATIDQLAAAWESPEAREGIAAFFDKRKPFWQL